MKKRKLLVCSVLVFILGFSVFLGVRVFSRINDSNKVIGLVNGEEIYQSDYERIKELNSSLSDDRILELVMKELLVYQEAHELGFTVSNRDLRNRIRQLKEEMPDMYSRCIEQYGSKKAYRTALSYTILYNMVYDYYAEQFLDNLNYNAEDVIEEIIENQYATPEEVSGNGESIITSFLKIKYKGEIRSYFDDWNEQEYNEAIKVVYS